MVEGGDTCHYTTPTPTIQIPIPRQGLLNIENETIIMNHMQSNCKKDAFKMKFIYSKWPPITDLGQIIKNNYFCKVSLSSTQ